MRKITINEARQDRADDIVRHILKISDNAANIVWLLETGTSYDRIAELMNCDRTPNFELKKAEDFIKLKDLRRQYVVITLHLLVTHKLADKSVFDDEGLQCSSCGEYHKELVELSDGGDQKYPEDHNTVQICVDCGIKALELLS